MTEDNDVPPASDAVYKNSKLITTADNAIDRLIRQARFHGRVILAMIISFALDVGLTVAVTLLSLHVADQASVVLSQAYAIHQSQLTACGIGNETRASERHIWASLLMLSASNPPPNQTPAQKAATARILKVFTADISHTFQPVDCGKLYPPPSVRPLRKGGDR